MIIQDRIKAVIALYLLNSLFNKCPWINKKNSDYEYVAGNKAIDIDSEYKIIIILTFSYWFQVIFQM